MERKKLPEAYDDDKVRTLLRILTMKRAVTLQKWLFIALLFFSSPLFAEEAEEMDQIDLSSEEPEKVDLAAEAKKLKSEEIRLEKEIKEAKRKARREAVQAKKEKRLAKKAAIKQKRERVRWERIKKNTESRLTLVHYDQFVIKTLPMKENFYIPEVFLSLDPSSVSRFSQKLAHHFAFVEGESVLLHFEIFYYGEQGVVYPNYVLQLNFDLPKNLFKNRQKISTDQLKGYLVWIHPDFPHGDLFLRPAKGHLYLWRIKKGHLMGRIDMKFEHEDLKKPIHLYGKVRAYQMTKEEYAAKEAGVKGKIAADAKALDELTVHHDRLRPRYEYKLRKKKDPWVEGRSSNLWQTQTEDLKD